MSKHLYFREQNLENEMRNADWDADGYVPPMDFNRKYGLKSVTKALRSVPDGPTPTSVNLSIKPKTDTEMMQETEYTAMLVLALLTGFYLWMR